jgi:NTE family protein
LAFSGGGFRAVAFGLGALRAIHDLDLLRHVSVVSGISGGSLLTAFYAYRSPNFDEFDLNIRELLRSGLQAELLRRAVSPTAMVRSLRAAFGDLQAGRPRTFSRTEALVAALKSRGLDIPTQTVNRPGLDVVISATDLATGNALRFGSRANASSPLGQIVDEVPVADAVAASAAYPLLLPALVRSYTFERSDGTREDRTVRLTDGGVYDNLGATALLPDRSLAHTQHVYDLDALIVVDAGRGRFERQPARRLIGRLGQTFSISHGRVQDGARAQLHERGSKLSSYLHVYLGTRDERLPHVADLVSRDTIAAYPTDFAAMSADAVERLSIRAEQITRVLAAEHLRFLIA